jgi:hypothetical protein
MKLVMAELDEYQQVHFSAVDAVAREGFAQYEVAVRRGGQVFCYYLNRQGAVWVPQIYGDNAQVAFGDDEAHAFDTLRAQRVARAKRMAEDLEHFRENTAKMRRF